MLQLALVYNLSSQSHRANHVPILAFGSQFVMEHVVGAKGILFRGVKKELKNSLRCLVVLIEVTPILEIPDLII